MLRLRRKPLPPDTRPDWRDPEMPVLREYHMSWPNGVRTIIDPSYEQRYRDHMMKTAAQPGWRIDPSYNWSRKHGR